MTFGVNNDAMYSVTVHDHIEHNMHLTFITLHDAQLSEAQLCNREGARGAEC